MADRDHALQQPMRAMLLIWLLLAAASCRGRKAEAVVVAETVADADADAVAETETVAEAETDAGLGARIDVAGLTDLPSCIVVRAPDGTTRQSDDVGCARRLRPASTFKIPTALIGADVGLLDGPDTVMTYDATAYPHQSHWPDGWDRDLPLREAMRISAVPLFRRLATQIGAPRMQTHLDALGYGNRTMTGGLDRFWLEGGGLAISAVEQVDFLSRLLAGTLPVSARAQEIVRAALPTEAGAATTLHWKTGTAREGKAPWTAWLVGWVERADGAHVFACWLEDPGDFDAVRSHRMAFCKGALARLGLFTAPDD